MGKAISSRALLNQMEYMLGKMGTNTKIYMVKLMEIKWENNDTKNFT